MKDVGVITIRNDFFRPPPSIALIRISVTNIICAFIYLQTFVCVPDTRYLQHVEAFSSFYATIECQQPIADLYRFVGRILLTLQSGEKVTRSLGPENVLLRGARLKNTPFVYGKIVTLYHHVTHLIW